MKIREGNGTLQRRSSCNNYNYLLNNNYVLTPIETTKWNNWKISESNLQKIDGAWFDPDGARHNLTAAPSPEGVPADMKTFRPQ